MCWASCVTRTGRRRFRLSHMPLTVVLTENALRERDVANILALHEQAAGTRYLLLVPADTDQNSLVEVINHLSLFEVRQAWEALTAPESHEPAPAEASSEELR